MIGQWHISVFIQIEAHFASRCVPHIFPLAPFILSLYIKIEVLPLTEFLILIFLLTATLTWYSFLFFGFNAHDSCIQFGRVQC